MADEPRIDGFMKRFLRGRLLQFATLAFLIFGCGKQPDANRELERAAETMASEEPGAASAAVPSQPTPALQPAPTEAASPAPAQQMRQALVAYKAGNLEDAVTRLQHLRAQPTMTPQQRMAMNDAMAAVMTEIYTLAAKGDGRAIQAVKQYEQMQTQRR